LAYNDRFMYARISTNQQTHNELRWNLRHKYEIRFQGKIN
jgi:hypothetical protein